MPDRLLPTEHDGVVVAVRDISADLPRHATERYATRTQPIERVYVHHSGKLGEPGIRGVEASARYSVEHGKRGKGKSPGWPGFAYHYWLPFEAVYDDAGRPMLYQGNAHDVCSWHTGDAANRHGLGVVLQGDLSDDGPSAHQRICLPALLLALRDELPTLDPAAPIGWHAVADRWGGKRKPTCPGKATEAWLRAWLASEDLPVPGDAP